MPTTAQVYQRARWFLMGLVRPQDTGLTAEDARTWAAWMMSNAHAAAARIGSPGAHVLLDDPKFYLDMLERWRTERAAADGATAEQATAGAAATAAAIRQATASTQDTRNVTAQSYTVVRPPRPKAPALVSYKDGDGHRHTYLLYRDGGDLHNLDDPSCFTSWNNLLLRALCDLGGGLNVLQLAPGARIRFNAEGHPATGRVIRTGNGWAIEQDPAAPARWELTEVHGVELEHPQD